MEFLLKAQKRMRRKLIIEQLVLLLLRCLLVFLVGLLLARYTGFGGTGEETRPTTHVVVLDDSPSMADFFAVEGRQTTAFDLAKTQVVDKIAPAAAQANTPQSMDVLLLSDLRQPNDDPATQKDRPTLPKPRAFDRLNDSAIGDMQAYLNQLQPSPVRVSLIEGLRTARELLDRKPDAEVAKVVHVVSDLRAADWAEDGEAIKQLVEQLTAAGVRIHLIDVAHPNRKESERQPRASDNLSITEFRPRARTVSRFQEVEFVLRVRNAGSADLKDVRVEFFRNGRRWNEASARVRSLPAGQERTESVRVPTGLDQVGTKDKPLDRFNLITARLAEPEAGGIAADNVRHAVVEVQDQLPVLVIEGRPSLRDRPKGDGFFLKKLLGNPDLGRVQAVEGTPADLDASDLQRFAAVYLMNVPSVTEGQRDKLEAYLRAGGGLGVFLGPDVNQTDYNKTLYRGGDGLLPFPLDKKSPVPTEELKLKRTLTLSKRVLTRDPGVKEHPAVVALYTNEQGEPEKETGIERTFMFATIDRHWEVQRLGKWQTDKAVRELYCLPNEKPVSDFHEAARGLLVKLRPKVAEPKFEKYRQYVDSLDRAIDSTAASGDQPLSTLATLYDRLICDQINDGDPSEPLLREMWAQPELTDLKPLFQRERDRVKYGDPLYAVKQFGQGRVAVMTTDAGGSHPNPDGPGEVQWTDWPSGTGAAGWAVVVGQLHRYIASGAADENRAVGATLRVPFDAAVYQRKDGGTAPVGRTFLSVDAVKPQKAGGDMPVVVKPLGDQPLKATAHGPVFEFTGGREPGLYVFTATQFSGPDGLNEKPTYSAYTFNLDAQREGDLKRANRDDLAQQAPGVPVHSLEDDSWVIALKQKRDDFSMRHWLYLFILLALVAEQAMAVRLSFHTRPEDLDAHAPSAAAAYHHGTAPAAAVAEPPAGSAGV